ncbi:rhombosortase [Paraglaciecola aestuariivivens]
MFVQSFNPMLKTFKPSYSLIGPVTILLFSLLLALTEPLSSELFAYQSHWITNGQWWRLITGHFLHTNTTHLTLNLLGLVLLWALHGQYYSLKGYIAIWLALTLGTATGLLIFAPNLVHYVGLSGALHGLFIMGAYYDIKHKLRSGWLILIVVWAKVIHEQIFGASQDVAELIEANVAIDAHLYGAITGTSIIIVCMVFTRLKGEKNGRN